MSNQVEPIWNILYITPISKEVMETPFGVIYTNEFETIEFFLDEEGKGWRDIDFKSIKYYSNTRIPNKCGNFPLYHSGKLKDGYEVHFKFKRRKIGNKK